ncbi:hypothetical protein PCANC_14443 [Puccinia coronata f. sp. avenae]|uniref:Uncharacterized protein n=1 Tax=Puccinia coronata f. sp. avenae TaxID=200324 RepID=A0A2N5USG7_9BASI|nr:hypothetical protein PCANC_14443 [Puccinia coronata f. sp. avenae]
MISGFFLIWLVVLPQLFHHEVLGMWARFGGKSGGSAGSSLSDPLLGESANSAGSSVRQARVSDSPSTRNTLSDEQQKELTRWLNAIHGHSKYWLLNANPYDRPGFTTRFAGNDPTYYKLKKRYEDADKQSNLTNEMTELLDKALYELSNLKSGDDQTIAIRADYLQAFGAVTPIRGSKSTSLQIAIWEYIQERFKEIEKADQSRTRQLFYLITYHAETRAPII